MGIVLQINSSIEKTQIVIPIMYLYKKVTEWRFEIGTYVFENDNYTNI